MSATSGRCRIPTRPSSRCCGSRLRPESPPLASTVMVRERNAARVVLVADGRVLLQHGFDPGRPEAGTWWITPGGGVNEGESVEDAAVREVLEETGLHLSPAQLGPVMATRVAYFDFDGRRFRQSESFFAVHVETFTPEHHGWDEV